MKNFSLIILIVLLSAGFKNATAQGLYPPKIQSPNVASIDKYGEVPVNLFTGTPDISIPVHTLKYGKISVPVTLQYNQALVKPSQHELCRKPNNFYCFFKVWLNNNWVDK